MTRSKLERDSFSLFFLASLSLSLDLKCEREFVTKCIPVLFEDREKSNCVRFFTEIEMRREREREGVREREREGVREREKRRE